MKKLLTLLLITFANLQIMAQGCSDAGFCTLNTIKDHGIGTGDTEQFRHQLTTGISYGAGQNNVSVTLPYLEYVFSVREFLDVGAKLTYSFNNGELGNVSGFGDLFISSNYRIRNTDRISHAFTLGFKVPLSDANLMNGGASLPMVYQVSLGTFDIIAGYNIRINRLGLGLAWQQPLTNPNNNEFIPASFPDSRAANYLPTRSFRRNPDVLLRATYSIPLFDSKLVIRPGLLPIYHLGEDTYVDENDMEMVIEGSAGLTLNANLFVDYNLNDKSSISLNYGRPWIAREAIPDGLLRGFAAGLDYRLRF